MAARLTQDLIRRTAPYAVAVLAMLATTLVLLLTAALLHVERVETYPLAFVLITGVISWRYGRGPGITATIAFAVLADVFFIPPQFGLGLHTISELVRLVTAIVAALAVVQVLHLRRTSTQALVARERRVSSRLELLEEVGLRIVRNLNADDIVATVATETKRVIDYHHFRLYRWNEQVERLILIKAVAAGAAYDQVDWQKAGIQLALGEGITGRSAQTRQPILVPDASRDPRMVYPPGAERLVECVLAVPMVTGDRLIGVLSLARLGAGSLTEEDQRLVAAIGSQTALALANADQYAEAEQTIKSLAALEELQLATANDSDETLHRRLLGTFAGLADSEAASMRLLNDQDGRYHLAATAGLASPSTPQPALEASDVSWLSESRSALYITDPRSDPSFPGWARDAARQAGVETSVFLPLRARQRFLGFVGLYWRKAHHLRQEQLGRLQLIAAQAAITLDTRRALEEERAHARASGEQERSRREFMQIASHELRTPLTVIRGYASLLEEGSLGAMPPQARAALKMMVEKSAEMRAQVERMLFLARLEEGRLAYQMAPLDLTAFLKDAIARVRPELELAQGTIEVRIDAESLPVLGDRERLGIVLDNLLNNAVKFSPGTPQLEIDARRERQTAVLRIRDHGIGIAKAAQAHLFEKFYRVDNPTLRNVGGTGIGLYLVRQVIEGHQGKITVDSEPGEGTTFTIHLPLALPADGPTTPPDGAAAAHQPPNGVRAVAPEQVKTAESTS
jgi:signal transduction histidine kinase